MMEGLKNGVVDLTGTLVRKRVVPAVSLREQTSIKTCRLPLLDGIAKRDGDEQTQVEDNPISTNDQLRILQCGKNVLPGIVLGYVLYAERIWKETYRL